MERYEVYNTETGESHGTYETLDEARGCALFDRLTSYEIWRDGDHLVAHAGLSAAMVKAHHIVAD